MNAKDKLIYGSIIALFCTLLILYIAPIHFIVVRGHSMEPTIDDGEIVVLLPVDKNDIQTGDIIAFRHGEKQIIHRVVNFENGMIITKGDNLPATDPYLISKSDVVGRYATEIPYLGLVVQYGRSPLIYIFLILVPAALLIYSEIRRI